MPSISVRRLYADNQHKLQLAWVAGNSGADNRIGIEADKPVLIGILSRRTPMPKKQAEFWKQYFKHKLNSPAGEK